MGLTAAKLIAERPAAHSVADLGAALERLISTRSNGGVRNSERAQLRLERRIDALRAELLARGQGGCP